MDDNQKLKIKEKIKQLITGEYKDELDEVSATGGVAGYQTPYAFSSDGKSSGNKRAATVATGYKLASKSNKEYNSEIINEDTDYNIKADYDAFITKLKNTDFAVETEVKNKLNKQLKGKKVMIHGSKGFKQFKKDYEVDVASVKIEDYYGNYEVVLVGTDRKEYFVDRNYKVKVMGAAAQPTVPAQPPVAQKPAEQPPAPVQKEPETELDKELQK